MLLDHEFVAAFEILRDVEGGELVLLPCVVLSSLCGQHLLELKLRDVNSQCISIVLLVVGTVIVEVTIIVYLHFELK